MEKYCTAGQATLLIRRMCIASWVPKATNAISEYVILIAFSTATKFARTRLSVALYVNCLSCYNILLKYFSFQTDNVVSSRALEVQVF